jgi:murein DD-endopeptidase MepM/ murein hydrolase activator NlpD
MRLKYFTVILVQTPAKFRKLRISNLLIASISTAALVLVIGSIFVTWAHLSHPLSQAQIDHLAQENASLQQANRDFEGTIRHLEGMLSDYEDKTRKLAIVAGLDDIQSGGETGIGGDILADFDGGPELPNAYFGLEARAAQLDGALDRVAAELDERSLRISSTPAITPVPGLLTSSFGYRKDPINGRRAFHPALDISAAPGKPVLASADAVVTKAGRAGGLGNAVYLSHGFGIATRYGHLSKIAVEAGQQVRRGDVIGYVGNSGRSTGYHLHYEVHVDGKPINGRKYITD